MTSRWLVLGLALTLSSTSLVACSGSDDDDGSAPQGGTGGTGGGNSEDNGTKLEPGSYRGVFSGGSEMGVIDVTVPEASSAASMHLLADDGSVPLTGTLTPAGGQAIELTGFYDPANNAISLSGGGYSLNGAISEDGFFGGYSGPNGSGKFQATSNADGSVEVYCGGIEGAATGPLTLLVTGSSAQGYVEPDGETPAHLSCTISGTNITCSIVEHSTVTVTGSSSETGWSGDYENTANGDKGTWTAGSCGG